LRTEPPDELDAVPVRDSSFESHLPGVERSKDHREYGNTGGPHDFLAMLHTHSAGSYDEEYAPNEEYELKGKNPDKHQSQYVLIAVISSNGEVHHTDTY
jgi:hypothetical protein